MYPQHTCRDVVESHDSIAVVLYHADLNSMLLVRQFRPALYASLMRAAAKDGKSVDVPLAEGFTCELCAGLMDKDTAVEEIVKEEIFEECAICFSWLRRLGWLASAALKWIVVYRCGYDVPVESIRKLTSYAAGVGIQGAASPASCLIGLFLAPTI